MMQIELVGKIYSLLSAKKWTGKWRMTLVTADPAIEFIKVFWDKKHALVYLNVIH